MKNLRFSSCPGAKVRRQGPPGSARAQPWSCCGLSLILLIIAGTTHLAFTFHTEEHKSMVQVFSWLAFDKKENYMSCKGCREHTKKKMTSHGNPNFNRGLADWV